MADIDLCPRCQAPLKVNGATSCECGWKKRARAGRVEKEPVWVSCAHMACSYRADVSLKTPTGWANLCRRHYDEKMGAEARAYTASLGLKSREDCIAYVRSHKDKIGKPDPTAWLRKVTQPMVNCFVADREWLLLDRLRRMGVIDAENVVGGTAMNREPGEDREEEAA